MELRQYLAIFFKWAWLIILTTGLAAGSSYLYSKSLRPLYRAETTILLGRVVENTSQAGISSNDVQSPYKSSHDLFFAFDAAADSASHDGRD